MPQRKCIGCNNIKDTSQMIRIMREHNTREVLINPKSSNFGRSSYLCYNKKCTDDAIKKRRFKKALKIELSEQTIEQLKQMTTT